MSENPLHLFEGYGIELEYMIVNSDTLSVLPICDKLIYAVSGTYESEIEMGEINWSNELVLHVIELKTNGPAESLESLPVLFQEHIRRINTLLEPFNARLMPTAMHPWMNPETETRLWPHEYSPVYESYNRIFGCKGHGWSNVQSMHINLPFSGDDEFGRLHAAVRLVLPLLTAISASSPVVDGIKSGFMDTRLEYYRGNQRRIPSIIGSIIPEGVYTRKDYETNLLGPIYHDIFPLDPSGILKNEWLNSRGAIARFDRGTIEIRVLDVQEYPLSDLAIAAIVVELIRKLVDEEWTCFTDQSSFPTERLADIFIRSIKNADKTTISDQEYLSLFGLQNCSMITTADLWQFLYNHILRERLDPMWRSHIENILDKGPLARRILKSLSHDNALSAIKRCYRKLSECLSAGIPFNEE